jgi:hypothetical protein
MPKNGKTKQPTRLESAPPGLLIVADILERIPDRADALLEHEITMRERERVLSQETKSLLSWHPWHTIRFLILSGAVAFAAAWFFSVVLEFVKLYNEAVGTKLGIPFVDENLFNLDELLPNQVFPILSHVPEFGALESFFIALGVVLLVALVKVVFILINWKKIKLLSAAEKELREELDVLADWKKELASEALTEEATS